MEEICYNADTFTTPGTAGVSYYYEGHDEFLVTWEKDTDSKCTAAIGQTQCHACFRCYPNDPTAEYVRVDCRNVPHGIATGCRLVAADSLFFPMDPYRLRKTNRANELLLRPRIRIPWNKMQTMSNIRSRVEI